MTHLTRRQTLQTVPLMGVAMLGGVAVRAAELAPTPACGDNHPPTTASDEGPYFKPSSPLRKSLIEAGIAGDRLVLSGLVLTTACKPIANATLDFWHADHGGAYDNEGFRLRGHQLTASDGSFNLETILPGLYPGRTKHIHVKVAAPGSRILTTQLYFPNEPGNARDGYFRSDLVMTITEKSGRFDFVLKAA